MEFNEKHLVIISSLAKEEASAWIKFLRTQIIRHQDDIKLAEELIERVKRIWGND